MENMLWLFPLAAVAFFATRPGRPTRSTQAYASAKPPSPLEEFIDAAMTAAGAVVKPPLRTPPASNAPATRPTTISARGLQLLKEFEGFRSSAYRDAAGKWTIGYGHLIRAGDGFNSRSTITHAQAEQLLLADVSRFVNAVRDAVRVPITQGQFDAMVSLAYNIGDAAFRNSTLLRKVNAGDFAGASSEFLRWIYAGGRVLQGLLNRRRAESALFNGAYV